ncbi:CU044_2847 family protein [Streptomyces canus]|uniref:CU044_2847 family protein n=1 Tax=Streptomyces canus TaxID=58343 RepID=UPI0033DE6287
MTAFVEVPLPDGGSLIVEQSGDDVGVVRAGRMRDVAEMATESFESALERLRTAADAVHSRMQSLSAKPSEITVEFAVKLGTSVGVVIANTNAEANLTLTLRWEPGQDS